MSNYLLSNFSQKWNRMKSDFWVFFEGEIFVYDSYSVDESIKNSKCDTKVMIESGPEEESWHYPHQIFIINTSYDEDEKKRKMMMVYFFDRQQQQQRMMRRSKMTPVAAPAPKISIIKFVYKHSGDQKS